MNTSKRTQRPILMVIAAVLALVLTVSAMGITVFADGTTAAPTNVKVSLDGQVNLMFKFTEPAASYTATVGNREIKDLTADDGWVSVPLYPYEMTETVTLKDDAATDAGITFSVVKYANMVLASDAHSASHDTVRAMLNYGAMTQTDRGHNTDNLANAGIFTKNNPKDAVTSITQDGVANSTGDTSDIVGELNLALEDGDIALKYTITYASAEATLTATIAGIDDPITLKNNGDQTYSLTISDIGVDSFDTIWDVTISDGAKSVNSKHSVLEYLGYRLTDTAGTETEKDVCRALYQLYQHGANALPTGCAHDGAEYWIPAKTQSTVYGKCSNCSEQIGDVIITDQMLNKFEKVTNVLFADDLTGCSIESSKNVDDNTVQNPKATVEKDTNGNFHLYNETVKNKFTATWLREAAAGTATNKMTSFAPNGTFEIANAQYMVIKLKTNRAGKFTIMLGTTAYTKDTEGATVSNSGLCSTYTLDCTKTPAEWTVFAISLSKFGNTERIAADGNGNRTIDTFVIESSNNNAAAYYLDIEYIAFMSEVDQNSGITIIE